MIKLRMVHRLRDELESDLCTEPLFAVERTVTEDWRDTVLPATPRRVMVPWCPVHGIVSITETASCSVSPHEV